MPSEQQPPAWRQLLFLEAPSEEARRELQERARELGCALEPFPLDGRRPDGAEGEPGDLTWSEPAVEEAAALSRALVEGTRDEVLVADADGRITFASPRLASLADLSRDSLAGEPADTVLAAIGLPEFAHLREMLSCVSCARMEAELVDSGGNPRPVLLRGVATGAPGDVERFVWFITELSRVRTVERANRILRSELKTQSRLLALVSHELRTPLNVILGQLSLLQTGLRGELTEEQLDSVERSERAGESLLALINDLIDFARLEAEELELELKPFGVDEVLGDVLAVADSLTYETELETVVEHAAGEEGLVANGDPDRTRQILIQLLTNAVKFSERGTIRLRVRRVADPVGGEDPDRDPAQEPMVAVEVRDSGIGIPDEELERVFEPFHQTAELLSRSREGSGLGLAIARRLARRQGGDLVAARSDGSGTAFSLYLPLADRSG